MNSLFESVQAIRALPAHGVLTICGLVLLMAGARFGVWQGAPGRLAEAKAATNEWQRARFVLRDAVTSGIFFGVPTVIVIMWGSRWMTLPYLVVLGVVMVPTLLQDIIVVVTGPIVMLFSTKQPVAVIVEILVRVLGDAVEVLYIALMIAALRP